MKKRAVIFDMDGVVSDTQRFHAEVESLILKDFNVHMTPETITNLYSGVPDDVMFREIFSKNHIAVHPPIGDIIMQKWDRMKVVAKNQITAIPYAIDLIRLLKANNFRLAIASASTRAFIDDVIDELNISNYFDSIVSSQEVEHGKPAPDVFILAAQRLQVAAKSCVVIEDGRSGMIGAKAAGMSCIGLVDNPSNNYPATITVSSLNQVTIDMIHSL